MAASDTSLPPSGLAARLYQAVMALDGKRVGTEIRFIAPCHEDHHPSARWNPEKLTWYCDVCGTGGGWKDLAERLQISVPGGGGSGSLSSPKRLEHSNTFGAGLTLDEYSAAKGLPIEFLKSLAISNIYDGNGAPSLRIPYLGRDGTEAAVRIRLRLDKTPSGDNRFRWKSGSKPLPYGLWRLDKAQEAGYVVIVEGESDAQTLWYQDEPALGIPGATTWREQWTEYLQGIPKLYVVREPDKGGEAVFAWLAKSVIGDRVWLVDLAPFKDVSDSYISDPATFAPRWAAVLASAVCFSELAAKQQRREAEELYAQAQALLSDPQLLWRVGEAIKDGGYAGDLRPAELVYVAATSRLLERPQNIAVVSQSAAGKNATVDAALELIPPEEVHIEKAGSARALIYSDANFAHKVVLVEEAESIPEDGPAASAVRSLAADNKMAYDVVEKNPMSGRYETRHIEKAGPTGLITTSTRSLGEQMGTRMLEMGVSDAVEQTREVMRAHARKVISRRSKAVDLTQFLALQRWLSLAGKTDVVIPYAEVLADMVPATAVRMRRDFRQLLTSVQTMAFLHQCQREQTPEGWVVASIEDYVMARELLAPIFDTIAVEGVTPAIRETVEAVGEGEEVSLTELARRLGIAKSTCAWRVRRAINSGFLVNNEARRGHEAKLTRGAPLPEETTALPDPEEVRRVFECSSVNREDRDTPSPLPIGAGSEVLL